MRARPARLSLLILALAAALPGAAAGKAKKAPKAPSLPRITGASSVVPVPWGFVALGGAKLRHLPTGKKKWVTLHTVAGDNLYRIATDDTGRLLAWWENEESFHLFVPAKKEHRSFAKPPSPGKPFINWGLDEIYFDQGGQDAILYMHGYTGGYSWAVVAYRYPLDGETAPTELFRQSGYQVHSSTRLSAFVLPKDPSFSCDYNGCRVDKLVAWEITDAGARQQVLLDAAKADYDRALLVWGSDGERMAIILDERKNVGRKLLRWRRGDAKAELLPVPKAPGYQPEALRLTTAGDVIEIWLTDDRGLELWRYAPKGERQVTSLAPLPQTDPEQKPLFGVYGFKERKNGDLLLHWGDYIYVVPAEGAPRRLWLEPLFKKNTEWAGAFIYVAEPEALWIGVEGNGRSFVQVPFAEIEKRAESLAE